MTKYSMEVTSGEKKIYIKKTREIVLAKYGGHCAYCGKLLDLKSLRVDHLHPII